MTVSIADTQAVSALTISDINTTVNHEPRILDIRLADALGFAQARDIRKLIERHRKALERFGVICATVAQTSPKGGRPARQNWLNKRQALFLCTKSETDRATEITIRIVEVFDEVTSAAAGQTPPPTHVVPVRQHERRISARHADTVRLADVAARLEATATTFRPFPLENGMGAMVLDGEVVIFDANDVGLNGDMTEVVMVGVDGGVAARRLVPLDHGDMLRRGRVWTDMDDRHQVAALGRVVERRPLPGGTLKHQDIPTIGVHRGLSLLVG